MDGILIAVKALERRTAEHRAQIEILKAENVKLKAGSTPWRYRSSRRGRGGPRHPTEAASAARVGPLCSDTGVSA